MIQWLGPTGNVVSAGSFLWNDGPHTTNWGEHGRYDPAWTPQVFQINPDVIIGSSYANYTLTVVARTQGEDGTHNTAGGDTGTARALDGCDVFSGSLWGDRFPDGQHHTVDVPAGETVNISGVFGARVNGTGIVVENVADGADLMSASAPGGAYATGAGSWTNTTGSETTLEFRVDNTNGGLSWELWLYSFVLAVGDADDLAGCELLLADRTGHAAALGYAEDPVEVSSGNFVDTRQDLAFPSGVYGLDVERTYNSADRSSGVVGAGWSSSLDVRLEQYQGEPLTLVDETGRRWPFRDDGNGGWIEPAGLRVDPVDLGDGAWRLDFDSGESISFDAAGFVSGRSWWDGQSVTITRDANGLATQWQAAPSGYAVTFGYNAAGRLVSATASDGRVVAYGYDGADQLVSVTDPSGVAESYGWDGNGRLAEVRDDTGDLVVANAYDTIGRVTVQTTGSGATSSFVYDPVGGTTTVTDGESGDVTTYSYDSGGRLVGTTDATGQSIVKSWTGDDELSSFTDRLGGSVSQSWDAAGNLTSTTDEAGQTTTMTYDAEDRLTSVTDPAGGVTTYGYDGSERIPSSVTDPTGAVTSYTVTGGLVESATDADGVTTSFGYDAARNLTSVTDGLGNTTGFTYDGAGRRLSETTPMGHVTAWTYDTAGRVLTMTDPTGATTTHGYDADGRLVSTTDATGAVTSYGYDSAGRMTSETDPNGNTTSYAYDTNDDLVSMTAPGGATSTYAYGPLGRLVSETDPAGHTTSYGYDADGRRTSMTDTAGQVWSYGYDALGRQTTTTAPDGGVTTTGYDALSRVTSVTDPLGNVTATTYNGRGDRLTTTAADGGVITNTYTPAGRLATVTDPTGDVTTYDYDGAGRQITMTDPLGGVTTTGLNADGEQVSVTSPAGLVTAYAYDAAGRNTTVTAPDGGITTSSYDAVGRVNTVTDPTGGVVDYDYDPAGRLTASTDPLGNTVTYGYDARGNRTGRTSPTGGTETWTYDLADRMTNAFDQLGNRTRVTFDDAGRVKRTFDPSGRNWRYVYDPNGRVDRVVYGDGTKVVYRWDVAGRVTRIIDDVAGTTKYSYDPVGRPLRRDDPDGTVFRQVYDAAGRVVRQFAPDGTKTVNRYDANGRIDRVVDPDFGNSGFVYDADGRLLRENLPGADDDRVYDYTDGRLTRFKQGADVTRMTYDPAGRVATVRGAQRWDYSYDAAGQLTSATRDGSDDFAYGYDAAGNRTTVDEPGSSADWAYAFDLANQVTERTPLAGGAVESTFTHDEAGRLTDWDSSAGVDNVYGYDVRGRLATTAETDGATVTTTTRTYRDENRLATIAIQVDSDPAETTTLRWDLDPIAQLTELTDPGSTAHRFTPGPAGRLAATASAGTAAFHYDWQGSAIATTATADLVPATSYDPYGQPDQIAASPGLGYRGELTAPDGLTHLRARDHEPELGRFTTRDPLDGIAGTTVETNTHHYANNDPINLIDPSGLRPGDSQFGCRNPHDDGSSIWSAIRRNTTGRFTTGSCALMQDSWFQASETFLYGGFVDPLAAVMASLHAALTDRGALLRGWDNLTQSWSRAWDRHGLTLLWRIPVKGVEQGVVDPARACGGSAQTREQQLTGCGQSAATIIGIAGVGSRAAANGSRGTTGTQKAGANAPTSAPNGPARFIDAGGTIIDRSSIRTTISSQRQGRHVLGDRNYSGGSYFSSADDAQRVLDDFHSGSAEILGIKGNDIVLRTDSVTGFNHNPGAGFPNQPTNVFFIKGSSSPSVVPYNPTWGS